MNLILCYFLVFSLLECLCFLFLRVFSGAAEAPIRSFSIDFWNSVVEMCLEHEQWPALHFTLCIMQKLGRVVCYSYLALVFDYVVQPLIYC